MQPKLIHLKVSDADEIQSASLSKTLVQHLSKLLYRKFNISTFEHEETYLVLIDNQEPLVPEGPCLMTWLASTQVGLE